MTQVCTLHWVCHVAKARRTLAVVNIVILTEQNPWETKQDNAGKVLSAQ